MDMIAFTIVYSIFSWRLLEFIIKSFDLVDDSWYINKDNLDLDEYKFEVMLARGIFYLILYCILCPLFLKK